MTKFVVPTQMYNIEYAIEFDGWNLWNPGVREEFENLSWALHYIKRLVEKVFKEMTLEVT